MKWTVAPPLCALTRRFIEVVKPPLLFSRSITKPRYRRGLTSPRNTVNAFELVDDRVIFRKLIADQHRVTSRRGTDARTVGIEQSAYEDPCVLRNGIHSVRSVSTKPSAQHGSPAILAPMTHRSPLIHEDIGAAVRAVIPPRRVPFPKQVFWRLVLWLMKSPRGRAWIARRYGAQ